MPSVGQSSVAVDNWHLDTITVESDRYGTKLHAHFDCWIDSTAPFTRALTP